MKRLLLIIAAIVSAQAASAADLRTNLVALWTLDEASGTRNDSIGTSHLTDTNTVTQAAGKVSSAAQFTAANAERLTIVDNAALSVADIDVTFAGWVYLDSKGATRTILSKGNGANSTTEYWLRYESASDRFKCAWYTGGGAPLDATASTFGAPSTGTWYFVVFWHDATADTINFQINNGAVDSAATAGAAPSDTAQAFNMGSLTTGNYWDGRLDEWGIWKRVLTSSERTQLYNGGNGLPLSRFRPDETPDSFLLLFSRLSRKPWGFDEVFRDRYRTLPAAFSLN